MRILLMDDDEVILNFLQVCLEDGFPGAEITAYPSLQRGRPAADFDWSLFDLLLLDYNLGNGEKGIDWLKAFSGRPGFPTTLLLTAVEDPYIVGEAVQCGAAGYLNKSRLTPDGLVGAVKDVLRAHQQTSSSTGAASAPEKDAPALAPSANSDEVVGGASYRFGRCIGQGAMSRVYLAERSTDGLTVVVKILDRNLAKDSEYLERFRLEGALVSEIDSPYIVKIFDRGITNSYDYIVMEFFGRGDLKQQIERGLSADQALGFLHDIACGLQAIHEVGIVHRDLKPANIMFRADSSMALADFGIAKRLDSDLSLTMTGAILGSLHYLSPEQATGMEADRRSDIYTAGVIFYEMLTGLRPYRARSAAAMLMNHAHEPVPLLDAPLERYQPLLERLMSKDIDARFQNASEVLAALPAYANLSAK